MNKMDMADHLANNFMCTSEEAFEYLTVWGCYISPVKAFIELRMALGLTHWETVAAMKAVKEAREG